MSSNNIKKSKETLKDKAKASEMTGFEFANFTVDKLSIDEELKNELETKGLAYRWINATQLKAAYGFHKSQWAPYKRDTKPTPGTELFYGIDPEGYVRRGDLILGVQSKELNMARKKHLAVRNKMAAAATKQAAQEIRNIFNRGGVDATVEEGYDEDSSGYKPVDGQD